MSTATSFSGFVPNGLLGSTTASSSSETSFTSNGLLSSASTSQAQENDAFKPNGLLGLGQSASTAEVSTSSFVPNGLLSAISDSQSLLELSQAESEFPSPAELVTRSAARSAVSSTSTFAGPPSTTLKATTFDGNTVFLRRKPVTTARRKLVAAAQTRQVGNLLDVPFHRLMDQISEDKAKELSREASHSHSSSATAARADSTLWVDRYRPKTFTDLMGNDRVAREAMEWLKQWDKCVFGRSKGKKRRRNDDEENYDVNDPYQRPKQRILLMSGPPGLGKTTLAHVIAKQAGYEAMEINASDARSGQIVDDRIRPTLEMGYTVKSSKPVLLVIDEIDGATGAGDNSSSFIHKLVQLIQDSPRKKNRSNKPAEKRAILRPIICICNDINAASLAKLRPHACQLRFQKPADVHTVKRLREICAIEGLKAETRALSTLVAIAKGDLRGCLNTLQFIRARNEEVTEAIVRRSTKGMKEADNSVLSALNSLFTPLSKRRVQELGLEEHEARYVSRLSHEIDACGKDSAIAIGCFSHYATLRRHDANFSRYEKANEWLMTFDTLSAAMYNDGDFALSPYLPYTLVPFYPLFQERGAPKVERGQEDWDNLQLTRTNDEIYKSLTRCLQVASTRNSGNYRHLGNWPIMQLEFAPYINRIISPHLRPINGQHMRATERPLMNRLVDIMSTLELRFVQERAEDGQLTYRLDPPADVFVTYDGKRASDITVSRYAVRHLVAQEVDARLSSRSNEIIDKGQTGKHANFFGGAKNKSGKEAMDDDDSPKPSPGKRPRTNASAEIDIADRPPTDFFGRLIQPSAGSKITSRTSAAVAVDTTSKFHVGYKYKEGNSAAVRKPIKISAFL
ncbi:hypothetical protein GYMLUDRAFT_227055 [Collybiopsis luxurians FD-317 M1]|uniref:AAA+ ATPase domain-containing protein n=1 Tax=Collybiopsis luxurians FD-317 M1 TaxID=944289 RepID=A0A0D0CUJ5_9AGAR|nr:hypothetical protein GYMLUDRAFT_227055 [Collybiopsis luxurians FD-317 M1]